MKTVDTPLGIKRRIHTIMGQVASNEVNDDSIQGAMLENISRLSSSITGSTPDGVRGSGFTPSFNAGRVSLGGGTGISNVGDTFSGTPTASASYNDILIANNINYIYVVSSVKATGDDYDSIDGGTEKIIYDNAYYVFVTINKGDVVGENAVLVSTEDVNGSLVPTNVNSGNAILITTGGFTGSFDITDPADTKQYTLSYENGLLVSKVEVTP